MADERDLADIARSIIDANQFMALGTADGDGNPWVSPVWYAAIGYRSFVWVSRPGTRHSRNIEHRPQVAITIFDSHRPGSWSAVYMAAIAAEVTQIDDALRSFNRASLARGLRAWDRTDVVDAAQFRLYRADVTNQYVLDDHDERHPVELGEPPGA